MTGSAEGAGGVAPGDPVTLVLASLESGGAERVLLNIGHGLCDRGHDVRLLVLDAAGPLRGHVDRRIKVVDVDRHRARSAGPRLARLLRREPPAAIIASQTHINLLLCLLRPLLPRTARMIVRQPSMHPRLEQPGPRRWLFGRLLGRADVVVASSTAMRRALTVILGTRAKVVLIPNPVDVMGIRSAVRPRTDPATPEPGVRIVSVGRLVEVKAHAGLLRALADAGTPHRLTIMGDGPLRTALVRLVHDLDLDGRVTFLGHIDDAGRLATHVANADLFVHASWREGLPNAVLEALALGTPVLATTDLGVLEDLAAEVGPSGLQLVPRAELAAAMASATSLSGPVPRPSLLPERFAVDAVVEALLAAIPEPERALDA